ncbi:Holliday junction DNA helicase RuvA [Candidatus Gottesmanbacteria bacterium RIFCSPLOWO2_01_FULL_48_11]|nr:MAG: Holliday junction DNA helicase RuvA [Candidatus Gottesmanbacteria bacterium RIFCSPLOWO2_01_FULL_48_11]
MIGMLTGTIAKSERNPIVLDVHGVGYAVSVPAKLLSHLTHDSKQIFHVYTHVADDALDLYGFPSEEELFLFKLLLSVSGIGPRTALAVVDHGVREVRRAVTTSDVEFFTTIPRLGRKNAQKIIIELKSKLGSTKELDLTGDADGETKQLLEALTGMGFARSEAISAIKKLDAADKTLEQKFRHALKLLGK